jgi:hypothetical protein
MRTKSVWYSYEGDCPECVNHPLIWVTPDGIEIGLCYRDGRLAKVRQAGWRLKRELPNQR